MTIQEAIEYMRMYKGENVNGESHLGHAFDLSDEIIDMAIEALQRGLENVNADSCSEEPNRSDTIYRQDAIDALMNDVTPYGLMDDEGNIESGCKHKDVIAMLYNLPSVNCSEIPNSCPSAEPKWAKKVEQMRIKAEGMPCVKNPLAWALYQVWKEYDR